MLLTFVVLTLIIRVSELFFAWKPFFGGNSGLFALECCTAGVHSALCFFGFHIDFAGGAIIFFAVVNAIRYIAFYAGYRGI